MITPYECEYTVMLSPPSAPVVKESTGITMFIIDEMREAREAKARLAKVIIKRRMFSKRLSSGTLLWNIFYDREHLVGWKLTTCPHPGPADQEDGHGAEDEEGGDGSRAEEGQGWATESCLQCAHFVTHPAISNPRQI